MTALAGQFTMLSRGGDEDIRLKAKDQKKFEAKNNPSEDRFSRGQEQECLRSRTQAQVFSKRSSKFFFRRSPKKGLQKFFQAISKKKVFKNFFSGDLQNFNNSKNSAVLEPKTRQLPRPRTSSRTPSLMLSDKLLNIQNRIKIGGSTRF